MSANCRSHTGLLLFFIMTSAIFILAAMVKLDQKMDRMIYNIDHLQCVPAIK